MANESVVLKRGMSTSLPSVPIVPGQILFERDTGKLHIDDTESSRVTVTGNDSTKVPLTGGTMTGPLILPAEQSTNNYAAVTKLYVNNYVSQQVADINTTLEDIGTALDNITVPVAASAAPQAPASSAAVGTSAKYAREDHKHPLQTTVSGNAGSATKLATARTITLTGDVTGSASFDGSGDISITTTSAGGGDISIDDGSIS